MSTAILVSLGRGLYTVGVIISLMVLDSDNSHDRHVNYSAIVLTSVLWPVTFILILLVHIFGRGGSDDTSAKSESKQIVGIQEDKCPWCGSFETKKIKPDDDRTRYRCTKCKIIFHGEVHKRKKR